MRHLWHPGPFTLDLLTAGGILLAFLAVMFLVRQFWARILNPYIKKTDTEFDDVLLSSTRGLILGSILLTGVYTAATSLEFVQNSTRITTFLGRALGVAWVGLAVWAILKIFNAAVTWYVHRVNAHAEEGRDINHPASVVRKAVNVVLLSLGVLYMLRVAGVDISPILASGAIGGLAAALALQDTLSNLFAGFFLGIDRPVKVGDFIKLQSGEEGFVEEIGWRNTKVRPWANNLVVIPNSKLSQTIITNYYLPRQEMSVYVSCGVAYGCDLQQVEDIAVSVAKEVMQKVPGADTEWEPVVRWKEFGDYAVTFQTGLRVRKFSAQYELQSEFIKALHRRFREDGIDIPSPSLGYRGDGEIRRAA